MKKLLTIILSVLLMATCFTVNTFAEDNETKVAENGGEPKQEISSETMKLVVYENNGSFEVSMIKENIGNETNPSYQWKIDPDDSFFDYADYTIFCKDIANKVPNYDILYNNETYSKDNLDINIQTVDNIVTARTTVGNNNVLLATYYEKVLYARGVYFDESGNMNFDGSIITAYDGQIPLEIFNERSFVFYYGSGYNQESSNDEPISFSSDLISAGEGLDYTINNNVISFNPTISGLTASVTYNNQTLTFISSLPDVGLYTDSNISSNSYCSTYASDRKEFYINWKDHIDNVSLISIKDKFDNLYTKDIDYTENLVENKKSIKVTFSQNTNITSDLLFICNVSNYDNNHFIFANCQRGDTLYARGVYFDESGNMNFDGSIITAYDGQIPLEIFNERSFVFYYGSGYNQESSNDEPISFSSDLISAGEGLDYTINNNVISFNPTISGLTASVTYNNQTLTFNTCLPFVGLYTSSVISELTYCREYNDTRKEFYINWLDNEINSVSVIKIRNSDGDEYTYNENGDGNDYSISMVEGQKSLKINFEDRVDITRDLNIEVNLSYRDGRNNNFYMTPAMYNSEYTENSDYITVNNRLYYKNVIERDNKTINCYIQKEINSQQEAILGSIDLKNISDKSNILVSYNELEYNEINRNKIFFDHGVYFLLEKEVGIEAFLLNDIDNVNLNNAQKIMLNPFELDLLFKNTSLDYSLNNTYLFDETETGYKNSFVEKEDSNFTYNKQYCWYSTNPEMESRIRMYSNFNEPVYFATKMAASYFEQMNSEGDVFSKQNETAINLSELQDYLDKQFIIGGSIIKIGNDITFDKDLRITNYADNSMNDVTSDNAKNSILIDLQGKTLNLQDHKIIISESSTVHIKDGTIIGYSDALFENYGGLSLDKVTVTNSSKDTNSYAIKTHRGVVYVNGKSSISAQNGIQFSDSYYKNFMDNSCKVSGQILATNNGVVFENVNETKYKEFLMVLGSENIDDNTKAPLIQAGNIAVKSDNKIDVMVSGTEMNGNAYTANIKGSTAIDICSGKLDIGGNVLIESTGDNNPNIQINSQGIKEDLEIKINVSHNTNFVSKYNVIEEKDESNDRNVILNIYYNQAVNNSKFSYKNSDPFSFSQNSNITKNISGGYYSSNSIKNHLTNDYDVVQENNLYKVVVNSSVPEDYIFNWDGNQDDTYNINLLKSYIENLGTRNIVINSFKPNQSVKSKFTIKEFKNISVDSNVVVNGITFIINAPNKEVHFNNGKIINDEECFILENGELIINNTIESTKEAILVKKGSLQLDPCSSVVGNVALNIQANNSIPKVSICGSLTGTGGTAMIYEANPSLSNDLNDYAVYMVNNTENGKVNINGGIKIVDGKLVTINTEINAAVGVELKGRSELVTDKETLINASDTGVYLNGSGTLFFDKGEIKAPYPIKVLDNGEFDKYQIVFMNGVHCFTNNDIINYINSNNDLVYKDERTPYNFYTEKAFFNAEVDETQFMNLNMLQNQGNELEGMYKCVQYKNINNPNDPYAYTIGYKLESVKHNSLHLNFSNNDNIKVDSSRLDYLLKNQDDNVWTLLVTEEAEIEQKPEDMLEAYDIQVRKVSSGKEVELLTETDGYQNIIIPVDKDDIDKITVSHKHNDEDTINLQKLTKEEALKFTKECYYVNNESSIGIITKRFSIFGIIANNEVVLPVASDVMNPTVSKIQYPQKLSEANLSEGWDWEESNTIPNAGNHIYVVYKTITDYDKYDYSVIEGYNPDNHRIERDITIMVEKATPSYTLPTNLTATYGNKLSDVTLPDGWKWESPTLSVGDATSQGRSFKAIFTPNDTNNYNIVEKDLSVIVNQATPDVSSHPAIRATYGDTFGSITLENRFSFKDKNSSDSVGDAGEYNVALTYTPEDSNNYTSVDVVVKLTVEKATPSYTLPTNLTATYGNKLSDVTLPTGWTWKDSSLSVGNATSEGRYFSATFTPNDTNNYNTVEKDILVKVNKATPTVSHPAIKATYGDTFGSIKLESGFSFNGKNDNDEVGNAGEYNLTLTYTPEDSNNYNSVDLNVKLTVEKAYPSKVVDIPSIKPVDKGTLLREISLDGTSFKWKDENAVVSDTNVALYTKDENHKTIEVNIPIAIKKTILVNGSNIKAVFTSSANNNASTTLSNTATTVTISNDALTSNAEKVVNRILNDNLNLGKIIIGENDFDSIKRIVSNVKTDDSLTLVVETVLNKEEKKIDQIDEDSRNKISSALNDNKVLSLFDLKVNLNVSSKDSNNTVISSSTTISELEDPLEIRIDVDTDKLPVAPENQRIEYFVIPLHDGVALDPIPATLINGKLVFVANKFSYYTLSYKLVDIPTIPSSSGSGNRKPVVNTASH